MERSTRISTRVSSQKKNDYPLTEEERELLRLLRGKRGKKKRVREVVRRSDDLPPLWTEDSLITPTLELPRKPIKVGDTFATVERKVRATVSKQMKEYFLLLQEQGKGRIVKEDEEDKTLTVEVPVAFKVWEVLKPPKRLSAFPDGHWESPRWLPVIKDEEGNWVPLHREEFENWEKIPKEKKAVFFCTEVVLDY